MRTGVRGMFREACKTGGPTSRHGLLSAGTRRLQSVIRCVPYVAPALVSFCGASSHPWGPSHGSLEALAARRRDWHGQCLCGGVLWLTGAPTAEISELRHMGPLVRRIFTSQQMDGALSMYLARCLIGIAAAPSWRPVCIAAIGAGAELGGTCERGIFSPPAAEPGILWRRAARDMDANCVCTSYPSTGNYHGTCHFLPLLRYLPKKLDDV